LHDSIVVATARPGQFASGAENVPMVQQMSEPKKAGKEVQGFMKVFGQSNRDDMPKKVPPSRPAGDAADAVEDCNGPRVGARRKLGR
jgi:hypothetical protein